MTSHALLLVMFLHVCWVVLLYVALTILRAPSAWGVGISSGLSQEFAALEPKVGANLSNQFEWPLLFYACSVLIVGNGMADSVQTFLAWTFLIGRVIHSFVHIFTNNIRLRGGIFTINFLAVFFMWIRLVTVTYQ